MAQSAPRLFSPDFSPQRREGRKGLNQGCLAEAWPRLGRPGDKPHENPQGIVSFAFFVPLW
ncbi:hypothetical protein, partial [Thiocystis minor]|uniref:hypothetical protein n=1 Tax=Thiocystis minor TaxID=61597 RepID=UPI001A91F76E